MKSILQLVLFCFLSFASKAYWQQHTATIIQVVLNDKTQFLHGFEKIVYTNNSPDTLRQIYVHLWPNAYKNDHTAFCEQQVEQGKTDFYFSSEKDKGYIDSLLFSIDGEQIDFRFVAGNLDIAQLELPHPLLPGTSVLIETPFRVKIPKLFSRLGHNGQAYFISQWFPKPAVYDHKGWHPMPYLDQGEFYSEFGSYDVTITLPKNYILMATGNCETDAENLWMDSLSNTPAPNDSLYKKSVPKSSAEYKTVRFTEDNIHDFAWFADKRWILRQDTFSGDGNDGVSKVFTAFLPEHQQVWAQGNELLKATVKSYGIKMGKYPYKTIKAVEGDMIAGGGMEYPTITIIDKAVADALPVVLIHEAGHNWFYGMLGSNEREHPWMDEGMNTLYEQQTTLELQHKKTSINKLENALYFYLQSNNEDQPASLHSALYRTANYGADVYYKSADLLRLLQLEMKDKFAVAMQSYFRQWKFKHPYPEDFKVVMQAHATGNLDWFFNGVLQSNKKIDLKLKNVRRVAQNLIATIENKSSYCVPVSVTVSKGDTLLKSITVVSFQRKTEVNLGQLGEWDKVSLAGTFTDFKLSNNNYWCHKILHKTCIELKPLLGLNRGAKTSIYIAPLLSNNSYNGFGLGVLLHNLSFPKNRFQFALAPMYSFGSRDINGVGAVSYSWFPQKYFKEIRLQTNLKTFAQEQSDLNITDPIFARYYKIAPSIEFIFTEKDAKSKVLRKLLLKQYNIYEQYFSYTQNPIDSLYRPSILAQQSTYGLLRFEHQNKRTFHPFGYNAEVQFGKTFIKLGLETNLRIDYDVKDKSLYVRAYAGKFISTNSVADNNRFFLNTTFSGANDYLFDGTYIGRNENVGIAAQQISMQEGGFKMPTNLYANPLGRSDDWLVALNLKTDLPLGKLPIRIYADIATFANAKNINSDGSSVSFNAGIELHLVQEMFSIYLPLVMNKAHNNYLKEVYGDKKFLRSIAFAVHLQHFNFLRTNDELLKFITP